ncbi:MAG: ribosome modulation factor [Cellvibrio sp.]|jgi:ribosome modulation factor|uniref:Ribosome modulation factor n=1 Tax=Cellvibrio fibrivorans TaxID=126350 RepID=A0ABU1UV74_9GAMM|nr:MULTISPECIES: ribosome modulation factor [Cellvibrio]MCE3251409.1 ribosome modulation factor [Cellvibrio sp.]EIK45388.1 ribosome modulation factor-related protein [Cellvibrio sp. BR]MDF3013121.1 ribosome modulation factor [Cellvibrio sp.]MDO8343195.1 ribosome modulation factor [Cellvibrio sp.]MDR7089079.1 ribosome modulation factor [Cellvibrio fibrivorans]|tara:strand:- start:210 stop:434 length:225 start_codon:yes stop_codon:yes gene_type:complete
MKRQKRDQTERAFVKGYQAGIDGRSKSLCPHETGQARQQWLNGWRESRIDQWDGYSRLAQVQKVNNIQPMAMSG